MAVQTLIENYGTSWFQTLIDSVKRGKTFEEALSETIPEWSNNENFYKKLQIQCTEKMKRESTPEAEKAYAEALEATDPKARIHFESLKKTGAVVALLAGKISSLTPPRDTEKLETYRDVWERFLKDHPNSVFAPAAHIILGNIYSRFMDPAQAIPHYEEVLKTPDFPLYDSVLMIATLHKAPKGTAGISMIRETLKRITDPVARKWGEDSIASRNKKSRSRH